MTDLPFPPGSQVVAYLRMSTRDQDLSILQQEAEVRSACTAAGLTLTQIFVDEARSGSQVAGRESFKEMVRYLTRQGKRPEDGVIVWRYNRLARDIDDSQFYKALLRRSGYSVISLKDNIPDTPEGRLMEGFVDWMSQRYLEDLRDDIKRGHHYIAIHHHGYPTGRRPLGYAFDPVEIVYKGQPHTINRLAPDANAPKVLQAFEMRAAGQATVEIHAGLRLFRHRSSYSRMLQNPIYIGILDWRGLIVEDFCPAIVPVQLWHAVQNSGRRLAEAGPRRQRSTYLLSGIVRCAACSRPLAGSTVTVAGEPRYRYYACDHSGPLDSQCAAGRIPAAALEEKVFACIKAFLLDPDLLARLRAELEKDTATRRKTVSRELGEARRDLKTAQKGIDRIANAIAAGKPYRSLLEKLGELEAERDKLRSTVARLENEQPAPPADLPADLGELGARFWIALENADARDQQLLLRAMLDSIQAVRTAGAISGSLTIRDLPGLGAVNLTLPLP